MATRRGLFDHEQIAWEDPADARRVTNVLGTGAVISDTDPMPVSIISGETTRPSSTSIEFQTISTVPTDTETTVLTFTNSGLKLYLDHIEANGTAAGEYFIYINTILKIQKRTTASEMNLDVRMYQFIIENGDTVDVKVKHYETATQEFNCSMRYER